MYHPEALKDVNSPNCNNTNALTDMLQENQAKETFVRPGQHATQSVLI